MRLAPSCWGFGGPSGFGLGWFDCMAGCMISSQMLGRGCKPSVHNDDVLQDVPVSPVKSLYHFGNLVWVWWA